MLPNAEEEKSEKSSKFTKSDGSEFKASDDEEEEEEDILIKPSDLIVSSCNQKIFLWLGCVVIVLTWLQQTQVAPQARQRRIHWFRRRWTCKASRMLLISWWRWIGIDRCWRTWRSVDCPRPRRKQAISSIDSIAGGWRRFWDDWVRRVSADHQGWIFSRQATWKWWWFGRYLQLLQEFDHWKATIKRWTRVTFLAFH